MIVAVLVIIGVVAARQVHVYFYPWRDCPRCGGSRRNNSGNAFRRCGRCNSTGEVRRFGAPRAER